MLLFAADALKSRGFSGDGDRPPFSARSRLKWSAAPTLAAPPPPKISVIIKRDRDGSTAIDPRCIGTVMVKPLAAAAAATPFGDNKSAVLVIVDVFGLTPVVCHWSTILIGFPGNQLQNWFLSSFRLYNAMRAHNYRNQQNATRTELRLNNSHVKFQRIECM